MQIEVRLFAHFRENRFKKKNMEVNESTTVLDILNDLNIKREDVSIILISGNDGKMDSKFKNDDVLSLFPPVAGG